MRKLYFLLKAFVKAGTITLIVHMIYLFMKAYQNNMSWMIKINSYGEAKIEAIFIILYLTCLLIISIIDLHQEKLMREENRTVLIWKVRNLYPYFNKIGGVISTNKAFNKPYLQLPSQYYQFSSL